MNEKYDNYGLAFQCPMYIRMENCPFKEMDDLPFMGKIRFINDSSKEKNEARLQHHKECFSNRGLV